MKFKSPSPCSKEIVGLREREDTPEERGARGGRFELEGFLVEGK